MFGKEKKGKKQATDEDGCDKIIVVDRSRNVYKIVLYLPIVSGCTKSLFLPELNQWQREGDAVITSVYKRQRSYMIHPLNVP